MVAQSKPETMQPWLDGPSNPATLTHVTLFILLAVRQTNHLVDLSPVVEARIFWAPDLDGARSQAHSILQADARIDHVSILDGQGHGVLGIANRTGPGQWPRAVSVPPPSPPRSRLAFH
jgi:hypothetical protein